MPRVNTPGAGSPRQLFVVVAVSAERRIAHIADESGFTFDVPNKLPGLEVDGVADEIVLKPEMIFSGIIDPHFKIRAVCVEDRDFCERTLFTSLGPDPGARGWEARNNPGLGAGKDPAPTIEWADEGTL